MTQTATQLRTLVHREGNWEGTITALAARLNDNQPASKRAPHLAIWLRRHEPMLFWHYGVCIHFSRTGEQRRVHISRRNRLLALSLSGDDSTSEISVVT